MRHLVFLFVCACAALISSPRAQIGFFVTSEDRTAVGVCRLFSCEPLSQELTRGMRAATLVFGGRPGGLFVVGVSAVGAPCTAVPGILNLMALDVATVSTLAMGTLETGFSFCSTRMGRFQFVVPETLPLGLEVMFQAVSVTPSGSFAFSSPVVGRISR